jgi:hypothetical protein
MPLLLALLAGGLPFVLFVAAWVTVRGWRLRGAASEAARSLLPRPLGLIGLALCVVVGIAGFQVPAAALGGAGGNTAVVVLMALACVGVSLGGGALGQRRAIWAGAIVILLGLIEWFTGVVVLFLSNVGMGMPGRPLRRYGMPVLPRVRRAGRRTESSERDARVSGLTRRTRRALARAWNEDARYEAASVPAFDHLARDLEVALAPAHLIAWARRAEEEENGHARLCFALASSYAGRTLAASKLPFAPSWVRRAEPRSALLARLAIDSLLDGCVGEEAAAQSAALGADRATDPIVRGTLERIAREEGTHAELGWAILGWLLDEEPLLASSLFERLHRFASERIDGSVGGEASEQGDLACHGRVSIAEREGHLLRASEKAKKRLGARLSERPDAVGPVATIRSDSARAG